MCRALLITLRPSCVSLRFSAFYAVRYCANLRINQSLNSCDFATFGLASRTPQGFACVLASRGFMVNVAHYDLRVLVISNSKFSYISSIVQFFGANKRGMAYFEASIPLM